MTSIGDSAFYSCTGLTEITIPDSTKSIGFGAFLDCIALTAITISDSVTSIGSNAFACTPWLAAKQAENPLVIVNGILIDGTKAEGAVIIPDSVTSIGDSAFYSCTGLTEITIPDSVTNIRADAFHFCTALTAITIPASVTNIEKDAFLGCGGLTIKGCAGSYAETYANEHNIPFESLSDSVLKYEIQDGRVTITGYTDNLPAEVEIPAEIDGLPVTGIGKGAFSKCENLTGVTIPDGVTSIGDEAFLECKALVSVSIPESVTSIGAFAFEKTLWLSDRQYEDLFVVVNGILIDGWACEGEAVIPDGVKSIGECAFCDNDTLTAVSIPESVTSIGEGAFQYCIGLTSVTVPDSVTSIGDAAFSCCDALTEVTIPERVTSMGHNLFVNSPNVTVRGYSGSCAETYANEHNIPFESLGEVPAVITGDVSGNGEIGADDAQMTLKAYVNILAEKDTGLTDAQKKAADVDGDGEITATDAQIILKYYVNTLAGKEVTWEQLLPKKE